MAANRLRLLQRRQRAKPPGASAPASRQSGSSISATRAAPKSFADIELAELNAELNGHLMRIKRVPPDGNSLFRAVSDLLTGTPEFHRELRSQVADFLEQNEGFFAPFLRNQDYQRYCNLMRKPGQFGSEVELLAISQMFQVHLAIHWRGKCGPDSCHRVENPTESCDLFGDSDDLASCITTADSEDADADADAGDGGAQRTDDPAMSERGAGVAADATPRPLSNARAAAGDSKADGKQPLAWDSLHSAPSGSTSANSNANGDEWDAAAKLGHASDSASADAPAALNFDDGIADHTTAVGAIAAARSLVRGRVLHLSYHPRGALYNSVRSVSDPDHGLPSRMNWHGPVAFQRPRLEHLMQLLRCRCAPARHLLFGWYARHKICALLSLGGCGTAIVGAAVAVWVKSLAGAP